MPLPIDNYQASLALTQLFPQQGVFPTRDSTGDSGPFPLGSIRTFAGNFAMGGQGAEGQVIPIGLNTALFSLLGNMYGGDGTANFALPNLDGRTMIGGAPLEYFGRPPSVRAALRCRAVSSRQALAAALTSSTTINHRSRSPT
jgi:microcystin-dependent protein